MATINLLDFTEAVGETKPEITSNKKVVGKVHIAVQKRNAKKYITSVEGLPSDVDKTKLLRTWKVKYSCNGSYDSKEDKMQLSGDQRENIINYLLQNNITVGDNIEVHGC